MKSLYIIGNGFDIVHGLWTNYWKFRTYLEGTHPYFLSEFETLYNIQPLDDTEPWYTKEAQKRWDKSVNRILWSSFEEKMGHPNTTGMLNFSSCVLDDLSLDGGNIGIRDTMDVYWQEKFDFINNLQDYVKEWIEQIDTSKINCRKKALIGSKDYFFNFNYTDILERVYHIENVLHIHGGVGSVSDVPPIMGHCNIDEIKKHNQWTKEADEKYEEGEASIQKAIAHYLETIYKDADFIISLHSSFFGKLQEVNKVIIIGWSAGDVDVPYLRKIKESVNRNTEWIAYWYDDEGYNSLIAAFNTVGIKDGNVRYEKSNEFWD